MIPTVKELREFMIPKLADVVIAAGRYKRPECEGCKKVWKEIQDWFDKKEKENFELRIKKGMRME